MHEVFLLSSHLPEDFPSDHFPGPAAPVFILRDWPRLLVVPGPSLVLGVSFLPSNVAALPAQGTDRRTRAGVGRCVGDKPLVASGPGIPLTHAPLPLGRTLSRLCTSYS